MACLCIHTRATYINLSIDMIDQGREDRWFEAEVMLIYRMSHGDRYFTHRVLDEKQEYQGEVYTIIDKYAGEIEDPSLIAHWPALKKKYMDQA